MRIWEVRGQVFTSPELKVRTRRERDKIREELFEENKTRKHPTSDKLRVLRSWKNEERGCL
jgi:hypothetical protein